MTVADVKAELDYGSTRGAERCLERLWASRLITPIDLVRRGSLEWGPAPGERIASLHFKLTARGKDRHAWWARKDSRWAL